MDIVTLPDMLLDAEDNRYDVHSKRAVFGAHDIVVSGDGLEVKVEEQVTDHPVQLSSNDKQLYNRNNAALEDKGEFQ